LTIQTTPGGPINCQYSTDKANGTMTRTQATRYKINQHFRDCTFCASNASLFVLTTSVQTSKGRDHRVAVQSLYNAIADIHSSTIMYGRTV